MDAIRAEFVDEACLWLVEPAVGTERLRSVAAAIIAEQDAAPELVRVASLYGDSPADEVRDAARLAIESITGRALPDEPKLVEHALRALCRATIGGSIAPRELTRWGYNRFIDGGVDWETGALYDLYLLDEDYCSLEWDRGRRTEHDIDELVLEFARRMAAR